MDRLLKLLIPLFYTPANYTEMLQRLAAFVFYEVYIITFLLRNVPRIGLALGSADSLGGFGTFADTLLHLNHFNISGAVIAFVIALLTFSLKLHDMISNILGIRRHFDRHHILIPLANLVGIKLTMKQKEAIMTRRDEIMRDVFYRYASSTIGQPLVDRHDIEQALGMWSWLWVCIEAVLVFSVAASLACLFRDHVLGIRFFAVAAILVGLAVAQYFRLGRYTKIEIATIANDPTAASEVRSKFNAL
jgi:hypothetical protein